MKESKNYKCENCGRPINHKGKCLKCNSVIKHERNCFINYLLNKILNIEILSHEKIQIGIKDILTKAGYYVELEKKIRAKRNGRIDLFAIKNNFSLGIEIDHSSPRLKSIDKLNTIKPSLSIFLLKSKKINYRRLYPRLSLIKVKSLLVHLPKRQVKSNLTLYTQKFAKIILWNVDRKKI